MELLLSLLSRAFKDVKLPKYYYQAKRYLRQLSLGYESIHVCKWDCAFFWKVNARMDACPIYGTSQWVDTERRGKNPI